MVETASNAKAATLGELLQFYAPEVVAAEIVPNWPPDIFALSAALLLESGAYLSVFRDWPPSGIADELALGCKPEEWACRLQELGREWRERWSRQQPPPDCIGRWWRTVLDHRDTPLHEIDGQHPNLYCSLLQLCAVADEASHSVGIRWEAQDVFGLFAETALLPSRATGSSLCRAIHPSKLRVLPKFHTPQTGMSLRSLSHHLALWTGSDVTPLWFTAHLPTQPGADGAEERHSLSLLLVPWPPSVTPRQFSPARPPHGRTLNLPRDHRKRDLFGFFKYQHSSYHPIDVVHHVHELLEAASQYTEKVDGVVLPELALSAEQYEALRESITARNSFLITGVGDSGGEEGPGGNRVCIQVPSGAHRVDAFQHKHHRWRLDRTQIVQYGLGGQLDPARRWWEYNVAEARHLTFVSLQSWLSLCALVCEDLARQDPVSDLVRIVGPNLVIALLMDGPQLKERWPARYATVLADDPGSSVLTLTSIGMCELSRPPGKPPSRTIALWKDAHSSESIPIDIPTGADAILLNLVRQEGEEWTADGRAKPQPSGYPALAGIHPVFRPRRH